MSKDKIKEPCFFGVNQEQMEIIQECFKQSGMKSFSGFLRQQVLNTIHLEYDKEELQKIRRAVVSCANNINQISQRVNSINRIYSDDINELKEEVDKIWQQLRSIQYTLQKLNPSSI